MMSDEPHPAQSQEAGLALAPSETTEKLRKKPRWWLWLLVCCLIGAAASGWLFYRGQGTAESGKAAEAPGSRVVSVVTAVARQGIIGIYLTGLGSVTAFNTVIARTRVDGQLVKVAFTVRQLQSVIKSDQAQIDSARLQLTYSRITAPITGQIGLRLVDQGNIVHANDQNGLAVITQLQPMAVMFTIPADNLPQVRTKLRSGRHLVVEVYDREMTQQLATDTLRTIDNQIDPNTGTVKCKAVLSNEDNALFPNQFVNVRLLVDTKQDTVIVPTAAIQRSPQGTFVYVVKDDSTVDMRPVVLGPTEGDDASVDNSLAPGEVVVIEGVDRLQRGMKVAARLASASNAEGTQ